MIKKADYILAGSIIGLLVLGIIILVSVSASLSLEKFGNTYYFLKHQLLFAILPGIVIMVLFFCLPLNLLKKWVPLLFFSNLLLTAMVFLPKIGLTLGGATRWLYFGQGIVLQPSEFLKLTASLYLASLVSAKITQKALNFSQTFIAFLTVTLIMVFILVSQPDISTLGIIILVGFIIYFSAGTPWWHNISIVAAGIAALFILIKMAPYRMQRWMVFLNPEIDPLGSGYQLKQSFIAVGSGGIWGLGFGMSRQKFGFLPESMTDSIFAVFSEEAGLIGALILILLFLMFLWRGFQCIKATQDQFLKLAALGISSWICLQAFFNIGMMIGILPMAGIPLPFISYGGSHLVAEMAGAGILLNISKK